MMPYDLANEPMGLSQSREKNDCQKHGGCTRIENTTLREEDAAVKNPSPKCSMGVTPW